MAHYPGYTVLRTEDCPEQHGTLTLLTHDVSGAAVLLVENEDVNKAFGIGFGTFPSDDTGVFHILEHSVLAGSEKYPVSSPFVQLLKSSMASFLNAMTFPDKTVYPFATPNETEAGAWAGIPVVDDASAVAAAQKIIDMGVNCVIMTLGKRGSLVYKSADEYKFVDAFYIENPVDTTGAGDAYNGGLAHALDIGMDVYDAVRYASAVGGLSVTKPGTAPAMPYANEVEEFLAKQK